MVTESYEIYASADTKLFCKSWQPADSPKALLFIVHGLGEHSGRYEALANTFMDNQIAVFAFDHRGHGKSGGKRGYAASIEQFVDDMELALMKCRSLFLEIPIFLYGHSMGGQIVASYLDKVKSKEINGAIISSAWFQLVGPPPLWLLKLIKKLALVMPRLTLSGKIDPRYISSVTSEVEMYKKDQLIHNKISLGLFNTLYYNGLRLISHAQTVKIQVLICHGDKDQITSKSGSEHYANKIGAKAEFKIWPGAFHECHHDYDKEKVIQFYVDWVGAIISSVEI